MGNCGPSVPIHRRYRKLLLLLFYFIPSLTPSDKRSFRDGLDLQSGAKVLMMLWLFEDQSKRRKKDRAKSKDPKTCSFSRRSRRSPVLDFIQTSEMPYIFPITRDKTRCCAPFLRFDPSRQICPTHHDSSDGRKMKREIRDRRESRASVRLAEVEESSRQH